MSNTKANNIKLGFFVMSGLIVLVITLYMIGSKRSVFSKTIEISAVFHNVNGLMPGHNVRYGGIDIGTVQKIIFESDSAITVKMIIEKKMAPYIKKNAIASIGTDGLMGNKLVNINSLPAPSSPIEKGDVLLSLRPVESDEMIRTLNKTNDNLAAITSDLKGLVQRFNKNNNLITLISDSAVVENLRQSIQSINSATNNIDNFTKDINNITKDVQNGKGVLGKLIADSISENQLAILLTNLQQFSDSLNEATNNINQFSGLLVNGQGTVQALLTDTIMKNDFNETLNQLKKSSFLLEEDLKALQKNFLFRKYFRQKEKRK